MEDHAYNLAWRKQGSGNVSTWKYATGAGRPPLRSNIRLGREGEGKGREGHSGGSILYITCDHVILV